VSRETRYLTVTLPNEQRIEVPEAVGLWSKRQEFAVENLLSKWSRTPMLGHSTM